MVVCVYVEVQFTSTAVLTFITRKEQKRVCKSWRAGVCWYKRRLFKVSATRKSTIALSFIHVFTWSDALANIVEVGAGEIPSRTMSN